MYLISQLLQLTIFNFVQIRAFHSEFHQDAGSAGKDLGLWTGVRDGSCKPGFAGAASGYAIDSTDQSDDDNLSANPNKSRRRSYISPHSSPNAETIYNGIVRTQGLRQYKMHQIAAGPFLGANIEDWDDSIHIANTTEIADLTPQACDLQSSSLDLALKTLNPLWERFFRSATCRLNRRCAYQVSQRVVYSIRNEIYTALLAWQQLAEVQNKGQKIWQFLKQSVVVSCFFTLLGAALSCWVAATVTIANRPVSTCSDKQDDSQAVLDTVRRAMAGYSQYGQGTGFSDITIAITLPSGQVESISTNARATGNTTSEVCGAFPPAPI